MNSVQMIGSNKTLFFYLTDDELKIVGEYIAKLVSSRPKEESIEDPARSHTYHYSESEKFQEELEPLPGVPRYSKVVVG